MIIDLKKYATEVGYWFGGFEALVDQAGKAQLASLLSDLGSGQARKNFRWATPNPIRTVETRRYDRILGDMAPLYLRWSFEMRFAQLDKARRKDPQLWSIKHGTTRIEVLEGEDGAREAEQRVALVFHFDLKSDGQLGPYSHFQVSDRFLEASGRLKMSVPRLPSAVILPTDCFDLVLSEFFPEAWRKQQSNLHGLNAIQEAQKRRASSLQSEIQARWNKEGARSSPVLWLQNCSLPDLRLA